MARPAGSKNKKKKATVAAKRPYGRKMKIVTSVPAVQQPEEKPYTTIKVLTAHKVGAGYCVVSGVGHELVHYESIEELANSFPVAGPMIIETLGESNTQKVGISIHVTTLLDK